MLFSGHGRLPQGPPNFENCHHLTKNWLDSSGFYDADEIPVQKSWLRKQESGWVESWHPFSTINRQSEALTKQTVIFSLARHPSIRDIALSFPQSVLTSAEEFCWGAQACPTSRNGSHWSGEHLIMATSTSTQRATWAFVRLRPSPTASLCSVLTQGSKVKATWPAKVKQHRQSCVRGVHARTEGTFVLSAHISAGKQKCMRLDSTSASRPVRSHFYHALFMHARELISDPATSSVYWLLFSLLDIFTLPLFNITFTQRWNRKSTLEDTWSQYS